MNAKNVGLAVGAVLGLGALGFVAAVMSQPDAIDVDRSVQVNAQPQDLWPLASDFAEHHTWDPWEGKDPDQKVTMSEQTNVVGATYAWEGPINGKGSMVITELVPNEKVAQSLEFIEPFPSKADVTMTLAAKDGGTEVHWTMHSPNDFGGKMAMLFMDIQTMLEGDYDQGLAKFKAVGEARAAERIAAEKVQEEADLLEAVPTEDVAVGGAVGMSAEGG